MRGDLPVWSGLYVDHGDPLPDSPLWRARIQRAHQDFVKIKMRERDVALTIERETGFPMIGHGSTDVYFKFSSFFSSSEIRQLIRGITVIWLLSPDKQKNAWRDFIERSLREENLSYTVDENCKFSYFIDAAFETQRRDSIKVLSLPRYSSALHHLEKAHGFLLADPIDTRNAVRETFDCAENLFRIFCGGKAQRLGSGELKKHTRAVIEKVLNSQERLSTEKFIGSFGEWIDGAHFIRHASMSEMPDPPSLLFTAALMSTGSGFIRWLAETDTLVNP